MRKSLRRRLGPAAMAIGGLFVGASCRHDPATETERGACYGNGTCDPGLSCLSNVCVAAVGAGVAQQALRMNRAAVAKMAAAAKVEAATAGGSEAPAEWVTAWKAEHNGSAPAAGTEAPAEWVAAWKAKHSAAPPLPPGDDTFERRYLEATLRVEATLQLGKIGKNAKRVYSENGVFVVGEVGLTPSSPCCQGPNHRCVSPVSAWAGNPIWVYLDFQVDEPSLFQYAYTSDGRTFTASAVGDLDCDGETITFALQGTVENGEPVLSLQEPPSGRH